MYLKRALFTCTGILKAQYILNYTVYYSCSVIILFSTCVNSRSRTNDIDAVSSSIFLLLLFFYDFYVYSFFLISFIFHNKITP